ncbi:YeiH family protein [Alkalibacterium sp. AK22]|uniref:YeiH family protein n=1 Tax=Alkalibacterium sp. AK22 TaxID=1229520 RepID=UPI000556B053|nr:YeiH family protein [Alkalibacterium sp. AK22]
MKKLIDRFPGTGLAVLIAGAAILTEAALPGHYIGSAVLAMFIGILIRSVYYPQTLLDPGVQFTSKRILKLAIVLLGASLNFSIILEVGSRTLFVLIFTLLTAFGGGYLLGKIFNVNWKLSNMIAAGTAICGGSAIAAMAPVIEAEDGDVSYAISSTFVFDMLMVILYPLAGRLLLLNDTFFGYWTGTSINDTSSVVAAGFAFSETAGEIATMVKLTRTLAIIPTVVIFSLIYFNRKITSPERRKDKLSLRGLIPWFIVFFVLMAAINTIGLMPLGLADVLRQISRFLMVVALAAIGLKTDIRLFARTGWKPFIHAMLLSSTVVAVSFAVVFLIID